VSAIKPLLISSGEPAGIGIDLCLALAPLELPMVVLCDRSLLEARRDQLGLNVKIDDYQTGGRVVTTPNQLSVLSIPCPDVVIPGKLNVNNAVYVLNMLNEAADRCLQGEFSALVTAPVHKAVINQAGFAFSGHTEFFQARCKKDQVVMLLASDVMKVALVTTHLPLSLVPQALSIPLIIDVITLLNQALICDFGIQNPSIFVAGLNPHAGEAGYLGREEIELITPALEQLKNQGVDVHGPFPADTMFTHYKKERCDAYVAMYHDQGLPVLKYAGGGSAVNVTLGLPYIRTSVDHGTALELAGTGRADVRSLEAAVIMAAAINKNRRKHNDKH